jgi:hypothetical protein
VLLPVSRQEGEDAATVHRYTLGTSKRERESALGAIVREGEAQELGGHGMRLDMIETRTTRDKKIEVVAILVFDTKIVDD